MAHDECAVRPRTGVGDIEMVATFLGWKFGIGLVLDPVSEDGCLALELAALVTGFDLFLWSVCWCKIQYLLDLSAKLAYNFNITHPVKDRSLPILAVLLGRFVHGCATCSSAE